ncbi:hypothetical protein IFM46972_01254 [Aspergillus udagawae]|uniref:Uncharacterized protein n=1 Tax=Aspergillus udagawae TaxID=91492 RepID=A0A8H3N259_9EURO|nr:hypothetical protein IFM46972_01254 [Aspergillus udagawae]
MRISLLATRKVADVWAFASVRAEVDGQRAALDEALVAAFDGAVVRTFVGVDAVMSAEVRLAIEGL